MIVHVGCDAHNGKGLCAESFSDALELLRSSDGERKLVIHGGIYSACRLHLTAEDSGTVVEAAGGERPVLMGAVLVSRWSVDETTGWFTADVPAESGIGNDFRLLIRSDGKYLKKARYPLSGRLEHETEFTAGEWVGSHAGGWQRPLLDDELNHFKYKKEDIPSDFDAASAEIQVFHSWNESYCKIARQDRENRTFWLTPNCTYPPGSLFVKSYAVYNTREGMEEPGRWYCDRTANKIYYRPYPEECVENFSCFVPVTTRILEMDKGCRDITIRGLTLTGATAPVVNEKYLHPCQRGGAGFGVMEQDGAIHGEGLENIEIADVDIYNTGGYGIMLRGESLFVRNCRIHHTGAGGVGIVSHREITPETRNESWISCVEDCRIEDIGMDYLGACGIFSDGAMVRRNYVARTPYTSIVANGDFTVVEKNICVDPVLALTDGGCIYMHINKGCIIRDNVCLTNKQADEVKPLCFGIYLDSDTRDFEICGNVIKGFWRPVRDARRGAENDWHHNYMEYTSPVEAYPFMSVEFPSDKHIRFHDNIMCSKTIRLVCNKDLFVPEEEFHHNKAIANEVFFRHIDVYTIIDDPDYPGVPSYGGNNTISDY